MKYLLYTLFFTFATISLMAQTTACTKQQCDNNPNVAYKLYPTQNMWTFLKLDTRNGKIWQVQYSVKGDDYRFETCLNNLSLTTKEINGRFELYPTQNMFNFILLDKVDGGVWQVQWSSEPANRGVLPIR